MGEKAGFFRKLFSSDGNSSESKGDDVSIKTLVIVFVAGLVIIAAIYLFNRLSANDSVDESISDMAGEVAGDLPSELASPYDFSVYSEDAQNSLESCLLQMNMSGCFSKAAFEHLDASMCLFVSDLGDRNNCAREVAFETNDFDACRYIEDGNLNLLNYCIIDSAAYNGENVSFCTNFDFEEEIYIDRCFHKFAIANLNPEYCGLIQNVGMDGCYYAIARRTSNLSLCSFISAENTVILDMCLQSASGGGDD